MVLRIGQVPLSRSLRPNISSMITKSHNHSNNSNKESNNCNSHCLLWCIYKIFELTHFSCFLSPPLQRRTLRRFLISIFSPIRGGSTRRERPGNDCSTISGEKASGEPQPFLRGNLSYPPDSIHPQANYTIQTIQRE